MRSDGLSTRLPAIWRRLAIGALVFVAYYALARAGLTLATINPSASPVWPATGVAIALLTRLGKGYAVSIALAAIAANVPTQVPLAAVAMIALGNTLEALIGSVVFERIARRRKIFFGGETNLVAMCFCTLFATPVSATFGTTVLTATKAIPAAEFGETWVTWWAGDTLGMLLFAPLFLQLLRGGWSVGRPRWVAVAALAGAISALVFFRAGVPTAALFAIYPLLFLAVYALTPTEAGFITLLVAFAAVSSAATGRGPFLVGSTNENLIYIALFLASLAITEQGLQFIKETGNRRVSMIVLFAGWLIGAIVLGGFTESEDAADHSRFQKLVDATMGQFSQRAFLYESALRGGAGLFIASEDVTGREWREYVERLDIDRNYPGIHGLGYILVVPRRGLDAFVRRIRAEGVPDFRYHAIAPPEGGSPPPNRDVHYVIAAVEPRERNREALGLDVSTEANRYEGAVRAARTGKPEVTRPIRLVQDKRQRTGFLLYLPIRRAEKLLGWAYAPLTIDEFLGNAYSVNGGEVGFELFFDHVGGEADRPIYADLPEGSERARTPIRADLRLWGQNFAFRWYRTPTFQSRHDTTSAWVIFVCACLNVLLCAFLAILESLNRRANELAERQAGEIRLQQAKLEHSARLATLGEMAGGIAHEINNPLAILSGRALMLAKLAALDAPKPEAIRQNSEKIMETVERMAKIVSGLRSFSRNGERDPFRPVEIAKVFSATMDFCNERFRNQQIEFRVSPPPDAVLVCREVQVVQVLLNLLNNAFDAVLPAKERWIALAAEVAPDEVRFTVVDSGPGIPKSVAENMMTPFFTTKPVGHGTGIGLSISSGIAEEHAGKLRYDTVDGRTRFTFSVSRRLAPG